MLFYTFVSRVASMKGGKNAIRYTFGSAGSIGGITPLEFGGNAAH